MKTGPSDEMKPEPLTKGKIFVLDTEYPMSLDKFSEGKPTEEYIVFLSDVKNAVEWLLKELEKRIEELNEYEKMGFTKQFCANRRDEIRTYIIPLIKKAFEGAEE